MKAKNIKEIIKDADYGVDEAGIIAEQIESLIKDRIKELEKLSAKAWKFWNEEVGYDDIGEVKDKGIRCPQCDFEHEFCGCDWFNDALIEELKRLLGEEE